jgi:formate C-acetyltransferase
MTKGITAAMNSCTSLPFELFSGGASTMWDLDPTLATGEIVKSLFTTFFEQGGQIFQGNVTDVEELKKAQLDPERYGHVIVRVGGYSARFINLRKPLQDEIIARLRHKG